VQTIEMTIEVDERRNVTIQLPVDMEPGRYRAVLVVEGRDSAAARAPLESSAHDVGDFAASREGIPEMAPRPSVLEFLDALPPGPRSAPTWDEIERQFREERDAWDR
jgi:hypothetical protein